MHGPNRLKQEQRKRRKAYEQAKCRGLKSIETQSIDDALYWLYAAGRIGWAYHFGVWIDSQLEDAIKEITNIICHPMFNNYSRDNSKVRRVVHMASFVQDGGGHTEVIISWIRLLAKLGDINQYFLSSELRDSTKIAPRNLNIISPMVRGAYFLPAKGLRPSQKVEWIYQTLEDIRPDAVILHINPNDVFCVCAAVLTQNNLGAKVFYLNHADHVFSIGMSYADYVIEFRREGAYYTSTYRGIEPKKILLVPLTSPSRRSRSISRADLGVPDKCTLSITIANYYKLEPDGHWDFGKVIYDLLRSEPTHYHLMVGYGSESVKQAIMKRFMKSSSSLGQQLIWLGRRTDLDSLLSIADFMIESFPMSGGIVRLEAMLAGTPIVAIQNEKWPLHSATNALGDDYPLLASDNDEVVHLSRKLITDNLLRQECRERLINIYKSNFSESALETALKNVLSSNPETILDSALNSPPEYDVLYAIALAGRAPSFHNLTIRIETEIGYRPHLCVSDVLIRQLSRGKESFRIRMRR